MSTSSPRRTSHDQGQKHPALNAIQMLNRSSLMRVASQMDLAKGLRYTADKSQSLGDST